MRVPLPYPRCWWPWLLQQWTRTSPAATSEADARTRTGDPFITSDASGQTVRVQFRATTDFRLPTSIRIAVVSLR